MKVAMMGLKWLCGNDSGYDHKYINTYNNIHYIYHCHIATFFHLQPHTRTHARTRAHTDYIFTSLYSLFSRVYDTVGKIVAMWQ